MTQIQSDSKHLLGVHSQDEPEFNWTEVTPERLSDFITSKHFWEDETAVPQTAKIVTLLQNYVDILDVAARDLSPIKISFIPKPIVVVINGWQSNARALDVYSCRQQISLPPFVEQSNGNSILYIDTSGSGYFQQSAISGGGAPGKDRCYLLDDKKDWDPKLFASELVSINKEHSECNFSTNLKNELVSPCLNSSSRYLGFVNQSNVIVVTAKYLIKHSKKAVIATIAHELGHYYRGHSSGFLKIAPFFFIQDLKNELKRPEKTDLYPELQKKLLTWHHYDDELEAAKLGLGRYTIEEEADEIGVELLARIGFEKNDIGKNLIEFLETYNPLDDFLSMVPKGASITLKECLKLRAANWTTVKGKEWAPVLLSGFIEPHHGNCYRLYNIDREWDAHNMESLRPIKQLISLDDEEMWQKTIKESISCIEDRYTEKCKWNDPGK